MNKLLLSLTLSLLLKGVSYTQSFKIEFINGDYTAYNILEIQSTVYDSDSVHLILNNGNTFTWSKNILKSYRFFSSSLSIEELDNTFNLENLRIYPNPASDYVKLDFTLFSDSEVFIEILDLNGNILLQQFEGVLGAGKHNREIELDKLSEGQVFIRLRNKDFTISKKAIINSGI